MSRVRMGKRIGSGDVRDAERQDGADGATTESPRPPAKCDRSGRRNEPCPKRVQFRQVVQRDLGGGREGLRSRHGAGGWRLEEWSSGLEGVSLACCGCGRCPEGVQNSQDHGWRETQEFEAQWDRRRGMWNKMLMEQQDVDGASG